MTHPIDKALDRATGPTALDRGYVQVYTGDGKGKTTAALGLALRAAGAGYRVYFSSFLKPGGVSEAVGLKRFSDLVTCRFFGRERWIRQKPAEADKEKALQGLAEARQALQSGDYSLVILDEADVAVHFGLLTEQQVLDLLDLKPRHVELVFTGRRAPQRLIDRADLVTEMREIKHYYQSGVQARRGIES